MPKPNPKRPSALDRLISAIEVTGGLIAYENGTYAPYADPDWIDLGDAYLAACEELGREPLIPNDERNEPDDD